MPRSRQSVPLISLLFVALVVPNLNAAPRRRAVVKPDVSHFCDIGSDIPGIGVPSGFCLRKFADVLTPRVMAFAPNGDLFVTSPATGTPGGAPSGLGAIVIFRQRDTLLPPDQYTFASEPSRPVPRWYAFQSVHGLLVRDDRVIYTVIDAVYTVPYSVGETSMRNVAPTRLVDMSDSMSVSDGSSRWTHSLARGTNGDIYVSRGIYDTFTCPPSVPRSTAVLRIGAGHDDHGDIVTKGMRDPLYIRCMPWGKCYAAELSGDSWDAFGGTEKLVELHDGDDLGFPCCIERDKPNPQISAPVPDCSKIAVAVTSFPLHDTPFGFDWQQGAGWPAPYSGGFFVGLHGQFGSWIGAGLAWAPTDPVTHIPTEATKLFLTGVGHAPRVINRVADVMFAPDGRLFFTDDQSGAIYWIAPRTLKRPGF
jgi:glucose/arabinose dehydrogenase